MSEERLYALPFTFARASSPRAERPAPEGLSPYIRQFRTGGPSRPFASRPEVWQAELKRRREELEKQMYQRRLEEEWYRREMAQFEKGGLYEKLLPPSEPEEYALPPRSAGEELQLRSGMLYRRGEMLRRLRSPRR